MFIKLDSLNLPPFSLSECKMPRGCSCRFPEGFLTFTALEMLIILIRDSFLAFREQSECAVWSNRGGLTEGPVCTCLPSAAPPGLPPNTFHPVKLLSSLQTPLWQQLQQWNQNSIISEILQVFVNVFSNSAELKFNNLWRKWKSLIMSDSLWPHGLCSLWNSPGQNTRVGSLSLLQETFPAQGSNPGLPHCRRILYQLSRKGSPLIIFNCSKYKSKINVCETQKITIK